MNRTMFLLRANERSRAESDIRDGVAVLAAATDGRGEAFYTREEVEELVRELTEDVLDAMEEER